MLTDGLLNLLDKLIGKTAGSATADQATDSGEAISDKIGAYSGDGGAGADDSVKAHLDLIKTQTDALAQELLQRTVAKCDVGSGGNGVMANITNITDKGVLTGITFLMMSVSTTGGLGYVTVIIDGTTIISAKALAAIATATTAGSSSTAALHFNHRFNTSLQVQAKVDSTTNLQSNVFCTYTLDG